MAIAKLIRYNTDGSIKNEEHFPIEVEEGNRVRFRDNSFINDCFPNTTGYRTNEHPAGYMPGYDRIFGTVLRTDSVQQAHWDTLNTIVDMPVVVHGDDGSIIYCNPLNFVKL